MEMTRAQAAASPAEVTLGGKCWRISPLSDKDYGEFEAWVQDRYIEVTKRNLGDLSDSEREAVLISTFARAAQITIASPEALSLMRSVEGAAKLFWLSLHREQPDVTMDEVRAVITDPKTVVEAMEKIDALNSRGFRPKVKRPTKRRIKR